VFRSGVYIIKFDSYAFSYGTTGILSIKVAEAILTRFSTRIQRPELHRTARQNQNYPSTEIKIDRVTSATDLMVVSSASRSVTP